MPYFFVAAILIFCQSSTAIAEEIKVDTQKLYEIGLILLQNPSTYEVGRRAIKQSCKDKPKNLRYCAMHSILKYRKQQ